MLLALTVCGLVLLVLGKNPLVYYSDVVERGLLNWGGLQATINRMTPLLLIAAGLVVSFQAGISISEPTANSCLPPCLQRRSVQCSSALCRGA